MTEWLDRQSQTDLQPLLQRSLGEILTQLDSNDRHGRGLALEAVVFKLMRPLDLAYVATRVRGTATGGTEAAFIFELSGIGFSRWQVQCRNTNQLSLDDVAREVGFADSLKSDTVVIISTGEIDDEARRYADTVVASTSLSITLMDNSDISTIAAQTSSIADVLGREATRARRLKTLEVYAAQEPVKELA